MIEQIKELVKISPPLVSFLLTTLASIVVYLVKPSVKLIWGTKSNFRHIVRSKIENQPNLVVHTAHYVIQNSGRMPAKEIEIVLNYPPDEVSVWPQRKYSISQNNEDRLIVVLDFLAAREFVDLFLLSVGKELPGLLNVKCPENSGKEVTISYHRQYHKLVYLTLWLLIFLGVAFIVEKLIRYSFGIVS